MYDPYSFRCGFQAFKNKMYGSRYAWIIFGVLAPKDIFVEDSKLKGFIDCSSNDLKQAAHRYISTIKLDLRQDNNKTISGMVSCQEINRHLNKLTNGKFKSDTVNITSLLIQF